MALTEEQKKERSEYLEQNLVITDYLQNTGYAFISYASNDWKEVFELVVVSLQKTYGLRVYADKAFDRVNSNWILPMSHNIKAKDVVVVTFISQSYIESYACFLELLTAVNNNVPIVYVFIDDMLTYGNASDKPFVETAAKNEILRQGDDLCTKTNNTSSKTKQEMKSSYISLLTTLDLSDSLPKYDISSAFIRFIDNAGVSRKSLYDLNALMESIKYENVNVFDSSVQEAFKQQHIEKDANGKIIYEIECEFKNDNWNGQGTKIEYYESGKVKTTYDGGFADGKYNGQGVKTTYDKNENITEILNGEFRDDCLNGQGKCTWYNAENNKSSTYKGAFVNGKPNGDGEITWYDKDGNVTTKHTAVFKDGRSSGICTNTHYYNNGKIESEYVGPFMNKQRNGKGKLTRYDKDNNIAREYTGEFKDDEFNGQGTYAWYESGKIKSKYVGTFENDSITGQGEYIKYDENGNASEPKNGDFLKGVIVGRSSSKYRKHERK